MTSSFVASSRILIVSLKVFQYLLTHVLEMDDCPEHESPPKRNWSATQQQTLRDLRLSGQENRILAYHVCGYTGLGRWVKSYVAWRC